MSVYKINVLKKEELLVEETYKFAVTYKEHL